jgi:hypothetical protein
MKILIRNATILVFTIFMIQSCGVIEKRRYSNAWNINLSFNRQSKIDGQQKPIKKNRWVFKPHTESYTKSDTTSMTQDSLVENRLVVEEGVKNEIEKPSAATDKRSKKASKPIKIASNPITNKQIQNNHTQIETSQVEHPKEFFSFASALLFVLFLLCVPLILSTGWNLFNVFITIGTIAWLLAILFIGVANMKVRTNEAFSYLKNEEYYLFSNVMLLLSMVGLIAMFVYVIIDSYTVY